MEQRSLAQEQVEVVHQLVNRRRRELGQAAYDFSAIKPRKRRIKDWIHRRELFAGLFPGLAVALGKAGTPRALAKQLGVRENSVRAIINGSVPTLGVAKHLSRLLAIPLPEEVRLLNVDALKEVRKRKRISLRSLALVFDCKTHTILHIEQGRVDKVDLVTAVEVARWLAEQK